MIDRQKIPAVRLFDVAHGVQQFPRVGQVAHARVVVDVLERIHLDGAPREAADYPAGLVRGLPPGLGDQLFQLVGGENHFV